ncbi:MAG TPA: hypothetical protein VGX92_00590 [Pyrinomonadaceae bacterium]|jgi:hypothetical protein|nr:hypothetical protein [Pyrinomonadaceae bacterium]
MSQENIDPTMNGPLEGNGAPFLYMQGDPPPGGGGGVRAPSTSITGDDVDAYSESPPDGSTTVDAPTDDTSTTNTTSDAPPADSSTTTSNTSTNTSGETQT